MPFWWKSLGDPDHDDCCRGLAGWQLRRAQELIANHLSDGLSPHD